jgi:hypothetical protein
MLKDGGDGSKETWTHSKYGQDSRIGWIMIFAPRAPKMKNIDRWRINHMILCLKMALLIMISLLHLKM